MTDLIETGMSRRQLMQASAWAAPAVMIAVGLPAGVASGLDAPPPPPPPAGVISVRATGPTWESYTDQGKMPGFRFSATSPITATLVITKTGGSANASDVLFPYDSMVFTGSGSDYTASAVSLDSSKTKGVTIKNTPLAVGTYLASIYYPVGGSTVIGTATLTIYRETSTGPLLVKP